MQILIDDKSFLILCMTPSELIWKKSGDKSVQLVRGSFVPKYLTSYKIHILRDHSYITLGGGGLEHGNFCLFSVHKTRYT